MKLAEIYSVRDSGSAYAWKWRTADGKHESKASFTYFHDCVEDAQKEGYKAEFVGAGGERPPDVDFTSRLR